MTSNYDFEAERARIERWLDEVDLHVRGELTDARSARLERAAAEDPELRTMIDDARAARRLFVPARELRCPDRLTDDILAAVDRDRAAPSTRRSPAPRGLRSLSPSLGWTAAVAAVVALWALIGPGNPFPPSTGSDPSAFVAADGTRFSEDEVLAAAAQMELALSVLNRTIDRTGDVVRSEMRSELHDHLTAPLREGFGRSIRSIPFLTPGNPDDEHSGTVSPPGADETDRSRGLQGAYHGERT